MTTEINKSGSTGSWVRALCCVVYSASGVLGAIAVFQAYTAWRSDHWINPASGVLTALAFDLEHGVFYRPLLGPLGYGATVYFPLHFAVQALLMRLGASPIVSGRFLDTVAMVALLGGTYFILLRCGVHRGLAAVIALLALGTEGGPSPLRAIREDALAAALNVWGIGLFMAENPRWRRVIASAILFSLAFATKQTTVFGVRAAVVYLLAAGPKSKAFGLLAST